MANTNKALGLRPVACPGKNGIPQHRYTIAASNTAFAKGDLMLLDVNGCVNKYGTSSTGAYALQTAVILAGVCAGVEYTDSSGNVIKSDYCPGSVNGGGSTAYAYLYDDADTEFEIFTVHASGTSTAVAQTIVGAMADSYMAASVQVGSGGHAATQLDLATLGTAAALFRIVRLGNALEYTYSTTAASSYYAPVIVKVTMGSANLAAASTVQPGVHT